MTNIQTIVHKLQRMRAEFADRLHRIRQDRHHVDGPVSANFSEQVTERENDEVLAKLEASTAADLKQMEHALSRVEAGLYPICEVCGARVEMDRLRAMPFATTCVRCAKKAVAEPQAKSRRAA
jgi:DnaK suppressor protein